MSSTTPTTLSSTVSFRVARALQKAGGRKFRGFTLVELVVVITILAVLATVGFLSLSGYSKNASDSAVKTNLRAFAENVLAESEKNGDSLRKYIVHDSSRALSGAKFSGVELVAGTYGTDGTNYSVGTPDFAALRTDGQKFVSAEGTAFLFAAADLSESLPSGKNRSRPFFQVATSLSDGTAEVYGTYPVPAVFSTGTVSGLMAATPDGNDPLVGGGLLSADPWSLPSEITEIFATGSPYVANWASNTCDPDTMAVVDVAAGTGTIPSNLATNTVYRLSAGDYYATGAVNFANCSAMIGNGTASTRVWYSVTNSGTLMSASSKSNFIISGISSAPAPGRGMYRAFNAVSSQNFTMKSFSAKDTSNTQPTISIQNSQNPLLRDVALENSKWTAVEIVGGSGAKMYGLSSKGAYRGFTMDGTFGFLLDGAYSSGVSGTTAVYLPSSSGGVLKNLVIESGTGGMQLYNADSMTLENVTIRNNSGPWTYVDFQWTANGNTIRNVTIINNAAGAIYLPGSSSGNVLENLKVWSNLWGISIWGEKNFIRNVLSYDNGGGGLFVGGKEQTISNVLSINNTTAGFRLNFSSGSTASNVFVANNTADGLSVNSGTWNVIRNALSIKGDWDDIRMDSSTGTVLSDVTFGQTPYPWFSTRFYGLFQRLQSSTLPSGYLSGSTGDYPFFSAGTFSGSNAFNDSWTVIPNGVTGWNPLTASRQTGLTWPENVTFTFGSNVPNQKRPVRYNPTTGILEEYGTDGVDYDSGKKIGEW